MALELVNFLMLLLVYFLWIFNANLVMKCCFNYILLSQWLSAHVFGTLLSCAIWALKCFKNHTIRVLVATDIASRGIDVDKLSHVINFEIPEQAETYVHRIGRTGRAGATGIALSFCAQDEMPYLKDINKLIKKNIEVSSHPFS